MRRLQWAVTEDVTNESSKVVTARLLTNAGIPWPARWPGTIYSGNSESGKAMIGAPTGYGVAWLLADRIIELGPKTIDETRLFADDYGTSTCWAFRIVNAELNT